MATGSSSGKPKCRGVLTHGTCVAYSGVPDRRKHRGPHPQDVQLFGPESLPRLQTAAADLLWLLSRGYSREAALTLVGDRYQLRSRQRTALGRVCCSREERRSRAQRCISPDSISGKEVVLDGYNVLTTVEAALAGGLILECFDTTYRDLASMHGSFRSVAETPTAARLMAQTLDSLGAASVCWLLDRPVSNSGRLKTQLERIETKCCWSVELEEHVDARLARASTLIATADSAILDRCGLWLNLARIVVEKHISQAHVIRPIPGAYETN